MEGCLSVPIPFHDLRYSTCIPWCCEGRFCSHKTQAAAANSKQKPIWTSWHYIWPIFSTTNPPPKRSPQMVVKSKGIPSPPKMAEKIRVRIYFINCPDYMVLEIFIDIFGTHERPSLPRLAFDNLFGSNRELSWTSGGKPGGNRETWRKPRVFYGHIES